MDRPNVVTAHVLFIDMVGSSALPIEVFGHRTSELRRMVAETPEVVRESAAGRVQLEDTGDGLAAAFTGDPTSPLECARELVLVLARIPDVLIRAGIHSGPALEVQGLDGPKLTGAAFIGAKRAMEACPPGKFLVSATYGETASAFRKWGDVVGPPKLARQKQGTPLLVQELSLDRMTSRDAKGESKAETEAVFALPNDRSGMHEYIRSQGRRTRLASVVAVGAILATAGLEARKYFAYGVDTHFLEFKASTSVWARFAGSDHN
jgi:hypothetical protein